jgi:hypothetical protein
MYGLMGRLKAADGRCAELTRLRLAQAGALSCCPNDVNTAAHKAAVQPSAVKGVTARAVLRFAAFAAPRETRPVAAHAL